jgi:hypothetical protein
MPDQPDWREVIRRATRKIVSQYCLGKDHRDPMILKAIINAARDAIGPMPFDEMKIPSRLDQDGNPICSYIMVTAAGVFRIAMNSIPMDRSNPYDQEVIMQEIVKEANRRQAARDSPSTGAHPKHYSFRNGKGWTPCRSCKRDIDVSELPPEQQAAHVLPYLNVYCRACSEEQGLKSSTPSTR